MRQRKVGARSLSVLLCLVMLFTVMLPVRAKAKEAKELTVSVELEKIDSYGNIFLPLIKEDMFAAGYEFGDVVKLAYSEGELILPFCSDYIDVDTLASAFLARSKDDYVKLSINMGNFASTYNLAVRTEESDGKISWSPAEGVTWPICFTISMETKGGYLEDYENHHTGDYSNERSDYGDLTDEQFANFRAITTTGIREGVLYRTASPVNPANKRNTYADHAIQGAGVNVIMNLADDEETLNSYEGAEDSYYIKQKVIPLKMSAYFLSDDFREKLAKGLKFFAENKDGIYAVHCTEGKDRAGFVSAILECLMGASYDEVVEDYMISFYNYYGITPESPKYLTIANSNLVIFLQKAFDVEDLKTADLSKEAEEYIREIGLTDEEISALKSNLGIDDILSSMDDLKGKIKAKKGKIKVEMSCKNPEVVNYDVELVNKKGKKQTFHYEDEEFTIKKQKSGKYKVSITACMTYGNHEYHGETIKKTVKVK